MCKVQFNNCYCMETKQIMTFITAASVKLRSLSEYAKESLHTIPE